MYDLLVITGPTATGKTALGVEAALTLNGEVVSADSMQVYRGMDIGTAKPSKEELETVIGLQCGISIETAMRRYLMWCIREPEKFKAWYRHADIVNTDYEKRTGFYKKMLEWLDYAYGDSAFEAGIYTGMEEFCKRYDVEDKLVQEAERLLKR